MNILACLLFPLLLYPQSKSASVTQTLTIIVLPAKRDSTLIKFQSMKIDTVKQVKTFITK